MSVVLDTGGHLVEMNRSVREARLQDGQMRACKESKRPVDTSGIVANWSEDIMRMTSQRNREEKLTTKLSLNVGSEILTSVFCM